MRKNIFTFLCVVLFSCSIFSLKLQASTIISKGITDEEIFYVTYDSITISNDINLNVLSKELTMETVYDGIIATPPYTLEVTKIISGITYEGTLYLYSVEFKNGKTYATYKGTITAVN